MIMSMIGSKSHYSQLTFDESYKIVNHDSDIEVFNDIYNVLTKNGLIERTI